MRRAFAAASSTSLRIASLVVTAPLPVFSASSVVPPPPGTPLTAEMVGSALPISGAAVFSGAAAIITAVVYIVRMEARFTAKADNLESRLNKEAALLEGMGVDYGQGWLFGTSAPELPSAPPKVLPSVTRRTSPASRGGTSATPSPLRRS